MPEADVLRHAVALGAELGFPSTRAEALHGGEDNHVVRLRVSGGDVVVRFSRDPAAQVEDPFDVEAWCAAAAEAVGIATPQVLARSHVGGTSVLVHRYVDGRRPDPVDLDAWRALGRVAAALQDVDVTTAPTTLFSRFGSELDTAWWAHLKFNTEALAADDALLELGVYPASAQDRLRGVLRRLADRDLAQGLVHGDLSTRNQLVVDGGHIVLDWGAARVGPTPWSDLQRIRHWHRTEDRRSPVSRTAWLAAVDGAGVAVDTAEEIVTELGVLSALDVVRWARERRPDRLAALVEESTATVSRFLAVR